MEAILSTTPLARVDRVFWEALSSTVLLRPTPERRRMDLKSRLANAICMLKEPEHDVELLMSAFACCQKLFLQANDADGVCWSKEFLQGILLKYKLCELHKQELFHILVQCFGKEQQLETVESSVALAACYVARCSGSEESETWYLRSFREAKTDYLRFEAAIGVGKLLLKQQEGKVAALAWFMMAAGLAEKAMLPDSTTIARYQAGKTLVMLGCFEEYLQQDGSKFGAALVHMLKATTQWHQTDFSVEETVSAYMKARAMLVPLMANLQEKLAEYLSFCCSCKGQLLEQLLQYLSLDQFSKTFIRNCSRFSHEEAEAAMQVERFFFIYEIYRDSRKELIHIQEMVPFVTHVDPRPYLEKGIEFLYIEDPAAALEPLVMCQQAALQAGDSTGVFWASGHIVIYCMKQAELGQKELLCRLTRCFISMGRDGEHPEAWAAYYVGRAANKDGKADHEMLKTALTNSRTLALGYYASEALGNASTDITIEVQYYERMLNYAKRLGKEDLIIYASLVLFGHLHNFSVLSVQSYERADHVRRELKSLVPRFQEPTLGQAAVSYMEAFQYFDGRGASAAFRKAINMLERLPVCSPRHLYHPYLAREDREDVWSVVKDHSAQNIQENALCKLSIQDHLEGRPTQQVLLHSLGEELHKSALLNRYFMNLVYGIDTLYTQERLEEAEAEAANMLQELEEQDDLEYSHRSLFLGLAFSYLGAITSAYQQREGYTLESSFDVFDMFMEEATSRGASLPTIMFYHEQLLAQQGRQVASIEKHCKALLPMCLKIEDKFGSFTVGRIHNLEGLKHHFRFLQNVLWENGEMERALIWAERERTRDLLYTLKSGEDRESYLQRLAEFDENDEKAWAEIQDVCNIMGEETVILFITQTMKHLLIYMLHSGTGLKGHKHYIDIPLGFDARALNSSFTEEALLLGLALHHEVLIKPFSEDLERIQPKRIIFVPNQDLSSFPFSALLDSSRSDKPYLIQRYSTTTVSSLRLLKRCEIRRQQLQKHYSEHPTLTSLVVGNPTLDLEEALKESEFVSSTLKQAGFSTVNNPPPENATKEPILRMLPESDWIHFATHGLVNAEFPDGALLLAKGGTRTTQALRTCVEDNMVELQHELAVVVEEAFRSAGAAGILTSEEIVENISGPLKAAAIVLSACSSGVGRVFAEGVLALSRAFHLCHTPSTVVSLWNVRDESTNLLMQKLYTNLANGMEIAEALKEAMVEMIDEKDDWGCPYSPKSWAPFIISGSPFTRLPSVIEDKLHPSPHTP